MFLSGLINLKKKCNIHRAAGRWFSPGTPVSSTNKTDRHDITENIVESGVKHHKPSQKHFRSLLHNKSNRPKYFLSNQLYF
jgi:hypothetical protein